MRNRICTFLVLAGCCWPTLAQDLPPKKATAATIAGGTNDNDYITARGLALSGLSLVSDGIVVQVTPTNSLFLVTNTASFPFGISGVDYYLPLQIARIGVVSVRTNAGTNSLAASTTYPPGVILTNSAGMDPSTNFVDFWCALPPTPFRTNDPVFHYAAWETSSTLSNSVFTLSFLMVSNTMRVDNATLTTWGTTTNNHLTSGAGLRVFETNVTLAGVGINFTNPNFKRMLIRVGRGDDACPFPVTVGDDATVKVRGQ